MPTGRSTRRLRSPGAAHNWVQKDAGLAWCWSPDVQGWILTGLVKHVQTAAYWEAVLWPLWVCFHIHGKAKQLLDLRYAASKKKLNMTALLEKRLTDLFIYSFIYLFIYPFISLWIEEEQYAFFRLNFQELFWQKINCEEKVQPKVSMIFYNWKWE